MKKEMLINVLQAEECRIAIVENGILEELYVERASQESYVGNIYKGRVVNIEPSIQAVFVDFGIGRNGFLHASDVDPVYYKHLLPKHIQDEMDAEENGEPAGGRPRTDRNDRGDRNDRRGPQGERRDRAPSPRIAEPESSVTVPVSQQPLAASRHAASGFAQPPAPRPSDDLQEDFGFGSGIDDDKTPAPVQVDDSAIDDGDESTDVELVEVVEPAKPVKVVQPVIIKPTRPAPAEPEEPDGWPTLDDLFDEAPVALVVPAVEPEPEVESEEEKSADEPKAKPKGRPRAKKKADDATGEGEDSEAKAKAKPRRGKKKTDAEPANGDDSDAEPRVSAAEHRTTEGDEEPEIRPFFEGGAADDFDVDGPNDRFASEVDSEAESEDESESVEAESESDEESGEESAPEFVAAPAYDDDEFAPPPRRVEDDRGRRGGPPQRGGGGGRGGPPQRGGGRGGPPQRGGPPMGARPGAPRDRGFPRPPIQEIFKRGQEVIVQVIKEGIGTKGPTLSTFVSIAGRYLVLMPSLGRVGVSRKIEDPDARRRLRDIMNAMKPPKGVGFIVRTAAIDRNETELHNDLAYLLRLWQVVAKRIKKVAAPVEIYRESDMITRTIRDIFTNDIDTIWVDEANAFAHASEFLQIVMPRFASRIRYFDNLEPLFHKYGIEDEIAKINQKRIEMPQGGSIIIEQTEALVAIDVNSGNFRADNDAEETAFRMNMLAAKEIARQLRLRDLGGVIVNDFIDMRKEDHRRKVETVMRDALKRDRARTKVLRISDFGIIEMTRQRMQPSLKKRVYNDCSHCKGTGYIKTNETMGIDVMRILQLAAHRSPLISTVAISVHVDAAFYLLNRKRKEIATLEERAKMEVQIGGATNVSPDFCEFKCFDANGNEVRLFGGGGPPPRMFRGGGGPRQFQDRRPPVLD